MKPTAHFFFAVAFCLLGLSFARAQSVKVSVWVVEAGSAKGIPNALVIVNQAQYLLGDDGYRLLLLPQGKRAKLCVHSLGFADTCVFVSGIRDSSITVALRPLPIKIDEITVSADAWQPQKVADTKVVISERDVFRKPSLLADKDLLAGIQQLAGVTGGVDGFAGLFVRGGNIDQNLILIDGIPIYNVYHVYGLFSAMPVNGIKQVGLYQGGMPAMYGGKLSSVLDVALTDGNMQQWQGNIQGGIVSFSGFVEGPLVKDKLSFQVSARKTWLNHLVNAFDNGPTTTALPGFGDFHVKSTWRINGQHSLSFFSFLNRDSFINNDAYSSGSYYQQTKQRYGNTIAGLTHTLTKNKVVSTTQLAATAYSYTNVAATSADYVTQLYYFEDEYNNKISSYILQNNTKIQLTNYWALGVGLQAVSNRISMPQFYSATWQSDTKEVLLFDTAYGLASQTLLQLNPYADISFAKNDWFLRAGLRASASQTQLATKTVVDPRLYVKKVFAQGKASAHLSFDVLHQPIQEIRLSRLSLPTDYWNVFTDNLPMANSIGGEVGAALLLGNFELSTVFFARKMNHVFERLESDFLFYNQPAAKLVAPATAQISGFTTSVAFKSKRLTANANYTLQSSMRQTPTINSGSTYEFEYNHPNMVKTTGAILLKSRGEKRIEFAWFWYWATGLPYTYSPASVPLNPAVSNFWRLPYAAEKNNFRTPDYHRLDVSFRFLKKKVKGFRTFEIVFYNVYWQVNTFYISTDFNGNPIVEGTLPFMPMFSYSYEF